MGQRRAPQYPTETEVGSPSKDFFSLESLRLGQSEHRLLYDKNEKEGKVSKLLTITEDSAMTRLTVKTLYSKTCRREVPFTKLGGRLLFDEDRLRAWIDSHAVEPLATPAAS